MLILQVSILEGSLTLSLDRIVRLLVGILTARGVDRQCIPRLDLMALNDRDLADLNLPADVRGRIMGQREALELRRRI